MGKNKKSKVKQNKYPKQDSLNTTSLAVKSGKKNISKKIKNLKTLDLHGYKSDEVPDIIDRFLVSLGNAEQARIMTGKGKGIVQKITIDYLKQAGYPWEYETLSNGSKNLGVLVIFC